MERIIDNIIILLENVRDAWQNIMTKGQNGRGPRRRRRIHWYRMKWRLAGMGLIAVTMPVVRILEGDATIALLTVPLGVYMMFGKTIGGGGEQ